MAKRVLSNYKLAEWLNNEPHAFFISELKRINSSSPPQSQCDPRLRHIHEKVLPELFNSVADDFFIAQSTHSNRV